ncbi:hypothetical protein LSG31_00665 [Fodinisporobacter ferrooxydans]|uniref:Uncharacterized protein n=1 Tax=Fodinisporobacter ferrooxydans TaxID=2901836 RepID=A0ABY4CK50_9BACL|nr:hypothetical protein LSG31_00665 [Alicyclobacillaceae bacterium MYW30-H2]
MVNIHRLPESDQDRLAEIAVEHSHLALEYAKSNTDSERQTFIRERILELRNERDAILAKC